MHLRELSCRRRPSQHCITTIHPSQDGAGSRHRRIRMIIDFCLLKIGESEASGITAPHLINLALLQPLPDTGNAVAPVRSVDTLSHSGTFKFCLIVCPPTNLGCMLLHPVDRRCLIHFDAAENLG